MLSKEVRDLILQIVKDGRTHNQLVLGSNPSGPTNQLIEDAVIRKTDATTREGLTGRLKLFSS